MVTSLQPGPWPGHSDNNAIIIVTIVRSLDYSNIDLAVCSIIVFVHRQSPPDSISRLLVKFLFFHNFFGRRKSSVD